MAEASTWGSCTVRVNESPTSELIPIDQPERWRAALEGIPHGFAHTWESTHSFHLTSRLDTYLYQFRTGDVRIVCPLSERRFCGSTDILTPFGFSGFVGNGDCPEFHWHWNRFVADQGYVCGYIALNPVLPDPTHLSGASSNNTLYVLDLTRNLDDLFNGLDRNRKRQLRNWSAIRDSMILDKVPLTDFLLQQHSDFLLRVGASPTYHFSEETLSSLCSSHNVLMLGATGSEGLEAVYVIGYTPYGGDCLLNVAVPQGRHHTTALVWYSVEHLKAMGVPRLNLGGGVKEGDRIAKAKQRFGAEPVKLFALKQVYRRTEYTKLCRLAKCDPYHTDGYFPAYQRPRT